MPGIKNVQIDLWNSETAPDVKDKLQRNNFEAIQQAFSKVGKNLFLDYTTSTAETTSYASELPIPRYSKAFSCNGGLLDISFKTVVEAAGTGSVSMYIDDTPVDFQAVTGPSYTLVFLRYIGVLSPGDHRVAIYANCGGAAYVWGKSGSKSRMVGIELNL
jgi:hypothetical protein